MAKRKKRRKLKRWVKVFLLLIIIGGVFLVWKNKSSEGTLIDGVKDFTSGIKLELDHDKIYLAIDEEKQVNINEKDAIWSSDDDKVALVEEGLIKGISAGKTHINAELKGKKASVEVIVTDLITKPKIDNDKEYLPCKRYSDEEAKLLDDILAYRIKEEGLNTRAGAVAAARFLSLEFPYRLKYFLENGRLITNGVRTLADGEGRYYHKGLYLSEDKYKSISASSYGPKIWGCEMYNAITGLKIANGLDCSGYVSWALLNAGFDVGDGGAGINDSIDNDLDDLGKKVTANKEAIASGNVKVGDLIGRYGHIGIIIGMDDTYIYIAEALDDDLHVLTVKPEDIAKNWSYIELMDDVYKEDGNLSNMW